MDIAYPIFIKARDSGEVFLCDSLEVAQNRLESIDVENKEYDAWDLNGKKLILMVQEPVWLKISLAEGDSEGLRKALRTHPILVGVSSDQLESTTFTEMAIQIARQEEIKRNEKTLSSTVVKAWGRLFSK